MTNEEKALEAARVIKEEIGMSEHSIPRVAEIIDWCLTWKDHQSADIIKEECNTSYESGLAEGERKAEARFKEYLEKEKEKFHSARFSYSNGSNIRRDFITAETIINKIINELFNNE